MRLFLLTAAVSFAQVTYPDLLKPSPANWLHYNGQYHSQRHSPLKQVNTENVGRLVPKWMYHVDSARRLESVPIVVDGVMYFSNPNEVYALDAREGREIWRYERQPALQRGTNRGVAVYGNKVFLGTPDAYLVALDARNGSVLWETKIAEAAEGYWSHRAHGHQG